MSDYLRKWKPIQDSIFRNKAKYLPDLMFREEFTLFASVGGDVFVSKDDFDLFQQTMKSAADKNFVIVQNKNVEIGHHRDDGTFKIHTPTRFCYPSNISWNELNSGGIIGTEHLNNGRKDYFVFGDSGKWGRYVANDWVVASNSVSSNPLLINGVKEGAELKDEVRSRVELISKQEPQITPDQILRTWLPESYKKLVSYPKACKNR